eukprot:jgi/Undpi1/2138/HiC_scaffold_12.g05524.m1
MDPSEVMNGEELEECTRKARAKLFRLADKEWQEMGIGNLKVLRNAALAGTATKEGGGGGDGSGAEGKAEEGKGDAATTGSGTGAGAEIKARLVMRREAGQQVMLNVALQGQTQCYAQGDKALRLTCFTPEGPASYLVKVKTPEEARSLKAAIDDVRPPPESA